MPDQLPDERQTSKGQGAAWMRRLPPAFFGVHLVLHVLLSIRGWVLPFELFNLMLLAANAALAVWLGRMSSRGHVLLGLTMMLMIASHGLIGQRMAPDSLTSGALLLVNLLVVYVGYHVFTQLSRWHIAAFVASYFILFEVFVRRLSHAEPLFLLALMGLAATARDLRLLAFFWALVIAFTFAQPYAWETAILSLLALRMIFSARSHGPTTAARVFFACGLLVLFFVLFPVMVIALGQTPQSITGALAEPEVREALRLTIVTSTISSLILALFGIPLAYGLSRLEFRGKALLLSLIDVPIVLPQSVAGIALLLVFGRRQYLGGVLFDAFGIRFDGAAAGICLAQIFVALPFMIRAAVAAFDAVPPRLEMAARHLGAGSFAVFRTLTLPLAARGLFLGAVLSWARAAGEFGAVYLVTAAPAVAPVAVFNRFERVGLAETAPMVAAMIFFSMAMFFVLQVVARSIPSLHEAEYGGAREPADE